MKNLFKWFGKFLCPETKTKTINPPLRNLRALDAKYLIVRGQFKLEVAILFSPIIQHSEMTAGLPVIAGGFFDGSQAYGHSESLGVRSRPEDTDIINQMVSRRVKAI